MDMTGPLIEHHRNYYRIAKAIQYLRANRLHQPSLTELSQHLHMSESHLQRLFSQWAGVSPKQFLQYLTKEHAKQLLMNHTVTDTALSVGLSGSSRLHDLMLAWESVTPGEYQRQGRALTVVWGIHPSPFGRCLLAATSRGICFLAFFDNETERESVMADFQREWGRALLQRDDAATAELLLRVFPAHAAAPQQTLRLLLKGSPFQLKVWEALIRIPPGALSSYSGVAETIGQPSAARAVASAIARNTLGYLIPCHRVIRIDGDTHQYRWGAQRKQALLAWEAAQSQEVVTS